MFPLVRNQCCPVVSQVVTERNRPDPLAVRTLYCHRRSGPLPRQVTLHLGSPGQHHEREYPAGMDIDSEKGILSLRPRFVSAKPVSPILCRLVGADVLSALKGLEQIVEAVEYRSRGGGDEGGGFDLRRPDHVNLFGGLESML